LNFSPDLSAASQLLGAGLMVLALVDVFITVLYARARGGVIARTVSTAVWRGFRGVAKLAGRHAPGVLSLCGPFVLVMLLFAWALTLTLGAALIMWPELGNGIRAGSGETPRDFMTALLAAGNSLSIVGAGDFSPHTTAMRALYLFNSIAGASVLSLTLTYLMQVYTALLRRNSFALTLHLLSGERDDAAELICGLGPGGDFNTGATTLAELSSELARIKETHHLYPVLFYFRFREPFYSVSAFTAVSLDTASLIESALDGQRHGVLKASGSIRQLERSALLLVQTLQRTFLTDDPPGTQAPDESTRATWRRRFDSALFKLRRAGISVRDDTNAAFDEYVDRRSRWNPVVMSMAPAMGYDQAQVDPEGAPTGDRSVSHSANRSNGQP
jgi:hypothetical protein